MSRKRIIWIAVFIAVIIWISRRSSRYEKNHWLGSWVDCDIWVWDSLHWKVVAEWNDMIYIEWLWTCLMYCLDNPYWVEYTQEEIEEMNITRYYWEQYTTDEVKYKSECYRKDNKMDKMKAIITRYWWNTKEE